MWLLHSQTARVILSTGNQFVKEQSMSIMRLKIAMPCVLLALLITLAACGGSASAPKPKPSPTPAPDRGAQLLTQAGQKLDGAQTLHAIIDITIAGSAI